MPGTVTEPSRPSSPLESSLGDLRSQIDSTLRSLPDDRLEARRIITRDLGIDPQPKEIEAIVRVAHDPASHGVPRALSCVALALRILSERSVRELMEPDDPSVASIGRAAKMMSGLLGTLNTWEEELHRKSETLTEIQRVFVLQVADALLPEAEPLIAGTILAPRLLCIIRGAEQGDPRSTVPSLTEDEVTLITSAFGRDEDWSDGAGSPGVTAVALRTVIEEDVAAWRQLDDEETGRRELLDRLKRERTAYRFVTRLLQTRQNAALDAELQEYADRLLHLQRDLFASYLELVPILNAEGIPAESDSAAGEQDAEEKLDQLLRESARLDARADAEWKGQTSAEEACLDAIKDIGRPARPVVLRPRERRGLFNERVRMRVLLSIASVLFLACLGVYGRAFFREKIDLRVPLAELPVKLELIDAVAVGSMLHATVSRWAWRDLTESQRADGVGELARTAGARGLDSLVLTDEDKKQLAVWTRRDGIVVEQ